ncbi:hypothetical protein DL93DRAFT_2146671 [Clavulina sp. PMI_390]|nr:hypothetical protein DL93DRAFT_2146671 [Clavulina sp. PMI_390]
MRKASGQTEAQLQRDIHYLKTRAEKLSILIKQSRRENRQLKLDARYVPERIRKQVSKALAQARRIQLKEKGAYTCEAHALMLELRRLGVPAAAISSTFRAFAASWNLEINGAPDAHTVKRVEGEGYIAGRIQLIEEMLESGGKIIFCHGDGTTDRSIGYESRASTMLVPDYEDPSKPKSVKTRIWGTKRSSSHDSETQLQGLLDELAEMTELYNGLREMQNKAGTTVIALIRFLMGMTSDHAEDQKKLSKMLELLKRGTWIRTLGEQALAKKTSDELEGALIASNEEMIAAAGGADTWSMLPEDEKHHRGQEAHEAMIERFGIEAYENLKDSEAEICGAGATLFVWAGCSMHKDLNAFKYAEKAVSEFWKLNNLDGPILLMNKDNAAAVAADASEAGESGSKTAAQIRALEASTGGAHKIITLAGLLFNHRDNKHGEGDAVRFWFEEILGFLFMFPDWIEYLELVRDRKIRPGLNHMEDNVYKGLHDEPTLTEMAAMALYAQAISKPYMGMIRGSCKSTNMLDMAAEHKRLIAHIEKLIANPDLLIGSKVSAETASFDGRWPEAGIVDAVTKLAHRLPQLRGAVVACFKGALSGWTRFTSEFEDSGVIASLNETHKEKIHLPNRNCHNESAFGQMKRKKTMAPNISEHTMVNLLQLRQNNTLDYTKRRLRGQKAQAYLRQKARQIDTSGYEKQRRKALVLAAAKKVEAKRAEIKRKAEAQQRRREQLEYQIRNTRVTVKKRRITKFTNAQLDQQLDFWRSVDKVTAAKAKKSHVKRRPEKIAAVKQAIRRYIAAGGDIRDLRLPRKDGEVDSDQSEGDESEWSEVSDDEMEEGGIN